MASFDLSATTGGARKHAWTKMILRQIIMIVNNAIFHLTRSLSWLGMSDPFITCRSLPAISAKRSTQEVTTCWNTSWLLIVLKLPSLNVIYVTLYSTRRVTWNVIQSLPFHVILMKLIRTCAVNAICVFVLVKNFINTWKHTKCQAFPVRCATTSLHWKVL